MLKKIIQSKKNLLKIIYNKNQIKVNIIIDMWILYFCKVNILILLINIRK